MANAITGKEYPLRKIFSSDFEYHIPAYQRPYAWTESETNDLFDDLYDFYQIEHEDSYFLGSIVLIKDESKPYADVIDGQQRLTTLSILFATMADCFQKDDRKKECKKILCEEGSELAGIPARPRMFLRKRDQAFFKKYIQDVNLKALAQMDLSSLENEAQRNIKTNCALLQERFSECFDTDEELLGFADFLLNRCFLIVVSTANQESAFRIFSVMNSRGLDLLPMDIIKSETIGKLPIDKQEDYTSKWEEMEALTGREGFNEVFTHTRMIFAKKRPKNTLLDEFREYVVNQTSPCSLIDDYLEPYSKAYIQLKNCEFSSTRYADEINNLLFWLNKTNNHDWMPPAIKFLTTYSNDSAYILWFIRKLERLASYLLVTSQDVNHRIDRYKWVLVEMESRLKSSLSEPLLNIELTEWEKEQFRNVLNGEIYTMTAQRRNYIIQRLDSFVSDGGASYNVKLFTIEHVLPQHPKQGSNWEITWHDEQVQKYWLNRIANLVPLTRQRNSAAQNFDFETKKEKYFKSRNGTSSYALTTQVISTDAWTPDIVEQRQKNLMDKFIEKWELGENNNVSDSADFMIAGRGGDAIGHMLGNEAFIVKKGSRIAPDESQSFQSGYNNLRKKLIEDGVIENNIFTVDYEFESPSAAAAVILGRSSNGRREWIKLDGRTIAQSNH